MCLADCQRMEIGESWINEANYSVSRIVEKHMWISEKNGLSKIRLLFVI